MSKDDRRWFCPLLNRDIEEGHCLDITGRASFLRTRQRLLTDSQHNLIPLSMALHHEGLQLHEARADKEWSLTDCISFVVMRREGLAEALTGDHHFEQARFVALLK